MRGRGESPKGAHPPLVKHGGYSIDTHILKLGRSPYDRVPVCPLPIPALPLPSTWRLNKTLLLQRHQHKSFWYTMSGANMRREVHCPLRFSLAWDWILAPVCEIPVCTVGERKMETLFAFSKMYQYIRPWGSKIWQHLRTEQQLKHIRHPIQVYFPLRWKSAYPQSIQISKVLETARGHPRP